YPVIRAIAEEVNSLLAGIKEKDDDVVGRRKGASRRRVQLNEPSMQLGAVLENNRSVTRLGDQLIDESKGNNDRELEGAKAGYEKVAAMLENSIEKERMFESRRMDQ
ncbi:hypothetical protein Ancab_014603, partial [Ancistrocladus abbreviatus]